MSHVSLIPLWPCVSRPKLLVLSSKQHMGGGSASVWSELHSCLNQRTRVAMHPVTGITHRFIPYEDPVLDPGGPCVDPVCVHSHLLCCHSLIQPLDALMQVRLVLQRKLQAAASAAQLTLQHMLLSVLTHAVQQVLEVVGAVKCSECMSSPTTLHSRRGHETKMVGVDDKPTGLNLPKESGSR